MTIQYQQRSINLLSDTGAFQGQIGGADVPIVGAAVTPLPLQVVQNDSQTISHTLGSSDIEFLAGGVYLVAWAISIGVASGGRKNSQTSLFQDTGGGFLPVTATIGYGYHRNVAAGRDTTSGEFESGFIEAGTVIRFASQRIAGAGNLEFIAASSNVLVTLLPPN